MAHRNVEKNELTLALGYDVVFDLVIKVANSIGKITDQNKTMGIINFKTGMKLLKMQNPVDFAVNVVKKEENSTLIRVSCTSKEAQGVRGMSSSQRSYEDFYKALSDMSK